MSEESKPETVTVPTSVTSEGVMHMTAYSADHPMGAHVEMRFEIPLPDNGGNMVTTYRMASYREIDELLCNLTQCAFACFGPRRFDSAT